MNYDHFRDEARVHPSHGHPLPAQYHYFISEDVTP